MNSKVNFHDYDLEGYYLGIDLVDKDGKNFGYAHSGYKLNYYGDIVVLPSVCVDSDFDIDLLESGRYKFEILIFRDGKFMNGVVHGFFDCRFVGWLKKRCVKQVYDTGFNIVYKDVWIRYDNSKSGYWYE